MVTEVDNHHFYGMGLDFLQLERMHENGGKPSDADS